MARKLKRLFKILKNEYHCYWLSVHARKYVKKYFNYKEYKWVESTDESNELFLKSWRHLEKMDKAYMRLKTWQIFKRWEKE